MTFYSDWSFFIVFLEISVIFYEQQSVEVKGDENFAAYTIESVHTNFLIIAVSLLEVNPS